MKTEFAPDLIVEATSICDRACAGCYAPNVVSKRNTTDLLKTNPEFFLEPMALENALAKLDQSALINVLSIRGGEPSRHPLLPQLIAIAAANSSRVVLETHGRWILESGQPTEVLLKTCEDQKVWIKLSFDRMHGLAADKLKEIWNLLNARGIAGVVAITEESYAEYQNTRSRCHWIPENQIVFQRKATSEADLIRPSIGVIDQRGQLSLNLTSRLGKKQNAMGVA